MTQPFEFEICAPSRLHFGLLSFGRTDRPQYGGLGVMVERPGLRLEVRRSPEFATRGVAQSRLEAFAQMWQQATQDDLPPVELRLAQAPAQHIGLGTGTQLGLTVAAALFAASTRPVPSASELAVMVGRAKRSSVGTYGFDRGGLIYELGKTLRDQVGQLAAHLQLPQAWRITLLTPARGAADEGLSGSAELQAFRKLPEVPVAVTERLMTLAEEAILPAARNQDLAAFGEAVYEYGVTAGGCFAEAQGGSFATPQLATWVDAIRALGVAGVGQSSWGPTLFAFHENEARAEQFVAWCRRELPGGKAADYLVTPVARDGARRNMRGL